MKANPPQYDGLEWQYANLFWRLVAGFIDCMTIVILDVVVGFIAYQLFLPDFAHIDFIGTAPYIIFGFILFAVVIWLYFATFESSIWQATPGKKLCKMIVVNSEGVRLTFLEATFRILLNMFRSEPQIIDAGLIQFTEQKQDLEDMISESLVLRRCKAGTSSKSNT
jgi:uncharacterized RDD family membrane protein YckC